MWGAELMTEVVGLEHPSEELVLINAAGLVDIDFLTSVLFTS